MTFCWKKGTSQSLVVGVSLGLFLSLARAQPPLDIEAYDLNFAKGMIAFDSGDYAKAEQLFTGALNAKPGDPEASYHLGHTLIRRKNFAAAEQVFQQMLKADPGSPRALLGLGIVRYNQERYREALDSLTTAEKTLPEDPVLHYYLGLVYHKLEAFHESPSRFLRAMTLSPELAPTAHYYSGVAYYRRGLVEQAIAEFEAVIATQPESELARSSKEFLSQAGAAAPTQAGPRRWSLSVSAASEWDSNVVLLPGGTQPPAGGTGISKQHDYRTVLYGRGEFRAIQTDTWTVGASYGIYQSFHRTLSGFDVEDHSPTMFVQRLIGPVRASLQYVYNYTLVGRAPYLHANAIQPIFVVAEGERSFTQVQFRYQYKDFQHGRFLLNSARDGANWLAGFTQYVVFEKNAGHVRFGYTFDTDRTGGGSPTIAAPPGSPENADWDYQGHRISGGLEAPLFWSSKMELAFDYYRQDYDNPNTLSADRMTRRRDNVYAFTGSVTRNLLPSLSASLQYNYTRDQCNVSAFDYNRSVYSLILSGSF